MKKNPERYTVTAALIYANGPVHIGHLAGCYLPADVYVRYLRATGKEVLFISGTDEHGVPITIKAQKEGKTPQEVVDYYYTQIRDSFADFGISFDIYSRTSRPLHHDTASAFFNTLYQKNVFTEQVTDQYFDTETQQFLADRYIVGTCPNCKNDNAYGDQCEKCGTSLSPEELINPHSALSGAIPIKKPTKNWYLPLDALQPKLAQYINDHSEWKSNVFGQCQSWLNQGLHPRAMTRDLDWGVKVPLEDANGKVLYVWFDAPIGYITATREYFEQPTTRTPQGLKANLQGPWEKWWKDEKASLVHFIGKDNIVFHCLIFPAMLMAHGNYILPDQVPANEFLNLEGNKISTSRNWAIWLHEYLADLPHKQDELRYVLTAISPETKDSDFTWKDYQARVNNELVAILGNFVNRVAVLIHKYFEGNIPSFSKHYVADPAVFEPLAQFPTLIAEKLEQYKFREAQQIMMDIARLGNKYLADTEPWKLIKTQPNKVNDIIYNSLCIISTLSNVMAPFLPFTAEKIEHQFKFKPGNWTLAATQWRFESGVSIAEPTLLFEKITDETVAQQMEKLHQNNPSQSIDEVPSAISPAKAEIDFEAFQKIDLRVGTILTAERVPKTDKLMLLTVDIGIEQRTIVSGIAHQFAPETLIGAKSIVLINLAPRKIKGITSQGMLLLAENEKGELSLMQPQADLSPGSSIS